MNSPGFKVASEVFGTEEMTTQEVLLMAQVARDNGDSVEEIQNLIDFVDGVLWYKKRQIFLQKEESKTRAGHYRRDSNYMAVLEKMVRNLTIANMEARGEDTSTFLPD